MKRIFTSILSGLVFGCLIYGPGYAQKPSVSVDNFSGNLSASIPLYNFRFGSISVPVMLTYNGGGVRVKEAEGSAGMGWNLAAGGAITRQVRGLPDDVLKDNSISNERKGWLYNTNGTKINNFTVANDNNLGTTADELNDYGYINNNFLDFSDTEPDIFYVNAPGLSCKLIFDNDHNIKTIPYQDIKVSYQLETNVLQSWTSYGRIKSFTITTTEGMTYVFDALELTTKFTNSSTPAAIKYFRKEYEQYKNGIEYVNAWKLSHIYDLSGTSVDFMYDDQSRTTSVDRTAYRQGSGTAIDYSFTTTFWTNQTRLVAILRPDLPIIGGVKLEYTNALTSGVSMIAAVRTPERTIGFRYTSAHLKEQPNQLKSFLTSVGEADTSAANTSNFGLRNPIVLKYHALVNDTIALPDSTSKAIDLWGYYNGTAATTLFPNVYINPSSVSERFRSVTPGAASGSYPYAVSGADRDVNSNTISNGSLEQINYAEGGNTSIVYEPKDYYDQTKGSATIGGGIRVKQIKNFDGTNVAGTIISNYSYLDPATGLTSGKPISIPLLSFITPFVTTGTTEAQWQNSVLRLEENFSQEENAVIYSHVKVAQSGAGSTLFEYSTPATRFDVSAGSDWTPSVTNISRISSGAPGYLSNESNTFPFIPNTNYDFERGMLNKVTQFNENGNKVSESTYSYQRTNAPVVITGFKFENNVDVLAYGKYTIYANVGKLTAQVVNKLYDAPSTTQFNQTSTAYFYNAASHKLPTLVQQANSDGSISRKYTKYLKDYDASVHTDSTANAIYNLQLLGCNFPIESYTQLERNSVNKTIGASLVKFKPFYINGQYRDFPSKNLSFLSSSGVSDFAVSAISSGAFVNDSRYIVKQNMQWYDEHGFPFTVDDNNKNVRTTLMNHEIGSPVAVFGNASVKEIGFNDFDNRALTDPAANYGFIPSGTYAYSNNSRSGNLSFPATSLHSFSRSITKAASRKSYIFSVWLNSATAGNITLTLSSSSSATLTYTLPFANTGGAWKYHELKVPVAAMSNAFTAKFQADANVLLDDVLFYPADAAVNTVSYNPKSFLKVAETNTNGIAQYYEYDELKRVKHILDQDKNIVLKRSYIAISDQNTFNSSSLSPVTGMVGQAVDFVDNAIQLDREGSIVWTWNFGDGTAPVSSTQLRGQAVHVYAATGNYTVTLTKTSNLYGTKTVTGTATIGTNTSPATIIGSGPITLTFSSGGSTVATLSGSTLWNGTGLSPGTYTVQFNTTDDPYDPNTNPSGFNNYSYALINASGQGIQLERCYPSAPKQHGTSFSITILAGRTYSFGTSYGDCGLVGEVQ